jgi:glycine cleavage system H protein
MSHPAELKYSVDNVWLLLRDDGSDHVGVTTQVVRKLTGVAMAGEIAAVQLPAAGAHVARDEDCGSVLAELGLAILFCPIAGAVLAGNPALAGAPDLVRDDPDGAGWIFKLQPANPADLNSMMNAAAYVTYVGNNG